MTPLRKRLAKMDAENKAVVQRRYTIGGRLWGRFNFYVNLKQIERSSGNPKKKKKDEVLYCWKDHISEDDQYSIYLRNSSKEKGKMHHSSWKVLALRLAGGTIGAL